MFPDFDPGRGTASVAAPFQGERAESLALKTIARVRRGWCGLHGHDLLLHFEPGRVMLKCDSCGWESPGWTCARAVH